MIKVVEITFDCEEEFNALPVVEYAIETHFVQITKIAALVDHWHVEEYTEEARMNREKLKLMDTMACLTQAMDAFREMYLDKEAQNATPE